MVIVYMVMRDWCVWNPSSRRNGLDFHQMK